MRVSSIGLYYNSYKPNNNPKQNINLTYNHQSDKDYITVSAPYSNILPNNISFTQQLPANFRLERHLTTPSVPCAYCGILTLPQLLFFQTIKDARIKSRSKVHEIVPVFSPFANTLHNAERKVFHFLEEEGNRNPKKSLQEILNSMVHRSKRRLAANQLKAFDVINALCQNLPPDIKNEIHSATANAKKLVTGNVSRKLFSRRTFLEDFVKTRPGFRNEEEFQNIYQRAFYLLYPAEDENNFIINHSRDNSVQILQGLFRPSFMTLDHIHPQALGGKTEPSNLAWVCARCNVDKGATILGEMVEKKPYIPSNCQRYVDILAELGFSPNEGYLSNVADTLFEESGRRIKLTVPRVTVRPHQEGTASGLTPAHAFAEANVV